MRDTGTFISFSEQISLWLTKEATAEPGAPTGSPDHPLHASGQPPAWPCQPGAPAQRQQTGTATRRAGGRQRANAQWLAQGRSMLATH